MFPCGLGNLTLVAVLGRLQTGSGSSKHIEKLKLITQAWAMLDKMGKRRMLRMNEKRMGHHLLWSEAMT